MAKDAIAALPPPGPAIKHSFGGSLSIRPWNKCADIHNYIIQEIDFTHKLGLDQSPHANVEIVVTFNNF